MEIYSVVKIEGDGPVREAHKWVLLRDGTPVRTFRTKRAATAHLRALGLCPRCSAPWRDGEPTCPCEQGSL